MKKTILLAQCCISFHGYCNGTKPPLIYAKLTLKTVLFIKGGSPDKASEACLSSWPLNHQLIGLIDNLKINRSNEKKMAVVFLDMEKAFDWVLHAGLLYVPNQLTKLILPLRSAPSKLKSPPISLFRELLKQAFLRVPVFLLHFIHCI